MLAACVMVKIVPRGSLVPRCSLLLLRGYGGLVTVDIFNAGRYPPHGGESAGYTVPRLHDINRHTAVEVLQAPQRFQLQPGGKVAAKFVCVCMRGCVCVGGGGGGATRGGLVS